MNIDLYWIPHSSPGRLGIMPRPRGGDWLEDEFKSMVNEKVNVLVSLLESNEIRELNLDQEEILFILSDRLRHTYNKAKALLYTAAKA